MKWRGWIGLESSYLQREQHVRGKAAYRGIVDYSDTDRHQRQRYDQDVAYHIEQPSSESVHNDQAFRFQ